MANHNFLTAPADDRFSQPNLKHHTPERSVEADIGMGGWKHWAIGLGAGVVLTLMLNSNTVLAAHTTALFATWAAYGIGLLASIVLMVTSGLRSRDLFPRSAKPSWWSHFGGIPGVFAVMLAAIAATTLGLVVSISFMLTGQILFGMAVDHWALFKSPKRRLAPKDFLVAIFVVVGSVLIFAFRN
jgi:bacterial/archaeal transporter family-2 protein